MSRFAPPVQRKRFRLRTFYLGWVTALVTLLVLANLLTKPAPSLAQDAILPQTQALEGSRMAFTPEEALRLPPKELPVVVTIGLYVSNLAQIDQVNETANVAGYLLYSWQDSRLAYNPKALGVTSKPTTLDNIWHPSLEMVNFKSSDYSQSTVDIAPDGTVTAYERFSKTLSSSLELQAFPFDYQKVLVVVESLLYPAQTVRFQTNPEKTSFSRETFASLAEWKIRNIKSQVTQSFFFPEKQQYSRAIIELNIQRNSGFYVLKVMMPLLLITIASWSVFWINSKEFSTQITIAFTNLLTVVALLLVVNDALPRVGYLTFLDGFTMLCFLGIISTILELLLVHRWELKDNPMRAERLHYIARWLIPSMFGLGNLLLLLLTFGWRQ